MSGSNCISSTCRGKGARAWTLCAVAITFLAAGCGQKEDAKASPGGAPPAMPVQVQVVQNEKVPDTSEYLSVLKSRHSAAINPQVEGQITGIFVHSGQRVRTGEPLLQIDPLKQEATVSSQEAARAAQEANVQLAKVSYDRTKKLYDAGVVSKQEFDSAQSTYDAAVAQLRSLEEQVKQQKVELHYYRVSAPMDGIVGDIPVHVGDRVTLTTLLTTVDEPGALEAYIYVPTDHSRDLKVGLPVRLLDADGNVLADTHITFVSPQVDTETQTILAKALVPNAQTHFRIAQQVRGQITWSAHEAPVIPVLSVSRINGQFFAFLSVNEGKGTVARQHLLKLGNTFGNNYVVLDGLKAGDHIILSGTQFLQDGAPVAEQMQSAPAASH
jgi:RND family efflux transporter MFP subunit